MKAGDTLSLLLEAVMRLAVPFTWPFNWAWILYGVAVCTALRDFTRGRLATLCSPCLLSSGCLDRLWSPPLRPIISHGVVACAYWRCTPGGALPLGDSFLSLTRPLLPALVRFFVAVTSGYGSGHKCAWTNLGGACAGRTVGLGASHAVQMAYGPLDWDGYLMEGSFGTI